MKHNKGPGIDQILVCKGDTKPSFSEHLEGFLSDLLDCEKEEGLVSPKSIFIRLPAGPLLYPFNSFKALQAGTVSC